VKNAVLTLLAAASAIAVSAGAHAQQVEPNWPTKPLRWIVPFPPGGAMDAIARTLGDKASKTLGQACSRSR
jgi:tripartite-type tricarboxylate transporter receptor subunit TctC